MHGSLEGSCKTNALSPCDPGTPLLGVRPEALQTQGRANPCLFSQLYLRSSQRASSQVPVGDG